MQNNWSASALAMASAANKNYLSVFNASNTSIVEVWRVKIQLESANKPAGFHRGFRLFRFTTVHSAGTLVTPLRFNTALSAIDPAITVRANGLAAPALEATPLAIGKLDQLDNPGGDSASEIFAGSWLGPIILNQNEGLVIQQDSNAGNSSITASIYFKTR